MTFDRDTALEELERVRGRKFDPLPDPGGMVGGTTGSPASLPADIPLGDGTNSGGSPSIVIAASDASDLSKAKADLRCTGIDDDVVIQAAIDTLTTIGGRVLLTEGTFNIDNKLTIAIQGIHIQGMGKGTKLSASAGLGADPLFEVTANDATFTHFEIPTAGTEFAIYLNGSDRAIFDGIIIDEGGITARAIIGLMITNSEIYGDAALDFGTNGGSSRFCFITNSILGAEGTSSDVITDQAGSGGAIDELTIANCQFFGGTVSGNIIDVETPRLIVNGCWLYDGGDGIRVNSSGSGERCIITNNNLVSQTGIGVYLTGVSYATVANNQINTTGSHGVHVENSDHVKVVGNHLTAITAGHGVFLDTCNNSIISHNTFEVIDFHGVYLNITSDTIVSENIMEFVSSDTVNTYDGVHLAGNSDRNIIHGNKIIAAGGDARYGVNISVSTCDDNRIGDNYYGVLASYGTFPLNDLGTDTRYPTARTADMSQGGALVDSTTGVSRYPIHEASIMLDAFPTVGTVPSGGAAVFDVNKNGTTMYATATNPQVASGQNMGTAAKADATLFAAGDEVRLDVDTANSAEHAVVVIRFLVA